MTGIRRFAPAFGLLLIGNGCSSPPEELFIESGLIPLDVAFILEVDPKGEVRAGPPFGRGNQDFGSPIFANATQGNIYYLVSFDEEQILEAAPGADLTRASELQIRPLEIGRVDAYGSPARVLIPKTASIHRVDIRTGTLLPQARSEVVAIDGLMLEVPTSANFCTADFETPRAFGASAQLLDDDTPWLENFSLDFGAIKNLIPLSRSRTLGLTQKLLFVLDEGAEIAAPSDEAASKTLRSAEVIEPYANFNDFEFDADRRAIWVVGELSDDSGGFVARFEFDGLAFGPAEILRQDADGHDFPKLSGVAVDDNGNVLLIGGQPRAFLMAPSTTRFREVILPTPPSFGGTEDRAQIVATTNSSKTPHLIGLKADLLLVGDATQDALESEYVRDPDDRPLGVTPSLQHIEVRDDERWIGGYGGIFSRWTQSTGWQPIPLQPNARAQSCVLGVGLDSTGLNIKGLAADDAHVFLVAKTCNGVIAFERERGCTGFLSLPGEPDISNTEKPLRAIALGYDRLWVGGELGRLFVVERP